MDREIIVQVIEYTSNQFIPQSFTDFVQVGELVRCKNCKKRYTEECGLRLTYMPRDDMFYCAAGRKK